jgi:hypothetical protein
MRSFSRTTWLSKGTSPSPVTRRLNKAPSRDTLPRERAVFPTGAVFPTAAPLASGERFRTGSLVLQAAYIARLGEAVSGAGDLSANEP